MSNVHCALWLRLTDPDTGEAMRVNLGHLVAYWEVKPHGRTGLVCGASENRLAVKETPEEIDQLLEEYYGIVALSPRKH